MPLITIRTNVSKDRAPKSFHKDFVDLMSQFLKVPRENVFVTLEADKILTRGGTNDPSAIVSIECIGRLKPQLNRAFGNKITEYLEKHLGAPADWTVIRFIQSQALFTFARGGLVDPGVQYDEDVV